MLSIYSGWKKSWKVIMQPDKCRFLLTMHDESVRLHWELSLIRDLWVNHTIVGCHCSSIVLTSSNYAKHNDIFTIKQEISWQNNKKNVGFDIAFILPQHKTTMRSDVGTKWICAYLQHNVMKELTINICEDDRPRHWERVTKTLGLWKHRE